MKFSVKSDIFQKGLQKVVGVIPPKTTLPILNGIFFKLENNELELIGTDLEVSLKTKIPVKGEINGEVVLPGKKLNELFRELPDMNVSFEVDEKLIAKVRTEKGETVGDYGITGDKSNEYPTLPKFDVSNSIEMDSATLVRMIEKTIFAVSSGEIRSSLIGVYIQFLPGEIRAVSTDGHRLVKYKREYSREKDVGGYIVSTKALSLLLRNIGDEEKTKILLSDNYIVFDMDDTVIYSRLLEGMYPDYEKVIPSENDKILRINCEEFISSIRRVSIFSNSVTQQIIVKLTRNRVELNSQDPDSGNKATDNIAANYEGGDLTTGYNAGYLLEMLRHVDTDEAILTFKEQNSGTLIFPSKQNEGEEILMLVMPIKLN